VGKTQRLYGSERGSTADEGEAFKGGGGVGIRFLEGRKLGPRGGPGGLVLRRNFQEGQGKTCSLRLNCHERGSCGFLGTREGILGLDLEKDRHWETRRGDLTGFWGGGGGRRMVGKALWGALDPSTLQGALSAKPGRQDRSDLIDDSKNKGGGGQGEMLDSLLRYTVAEARRWSPGAGKGVIGENNGYIKAQRGIRGYAALYQCFERQVSGLGLAPYGPLYETRIRKRRWEGKDHLTLQKGSWPQAYQKKGGVALQGIIAGGGELPEAEKEKRGQGLGKEALLPSGPKKRETTTQEEEEREIIEKGGETGDRPLNISRNERAKSQKLEEKKIEPLRGLWESGGATGATATTGERQTSTEKDVSRGTRITKNSKACNKPPQKNN